MKYPKYYLDEIKTRLKVSTVVSRTVNLKKEEKEFVGLSPFKMKKHRHLQSMMKTILSLFCNIGTWQCI